MLRHFVSTMLKMLPVVVQSEEGGLAPLSGHDMSAGLIWRTVKFETVWQDFRASGRTLYHAGCDSWGCWRVETRHVQ